MIDWEFTTNNKRYKAIALRQVKEGELFIVPSSLTGDKPLKVRTSTRAFIGMCDSILMGHRIIVEEIKHEHNFVCTECGEEAGYEGCCC